MTRCESYPLCSGTIYFPTAPLSYLSLCFFRGMPNGNIPGGVLFLLYNQKEKNRHLPVINV